MRKPKPKPPWHALILGISIFLGSILRIFPGFMTGFPLNDGGMFYVMIRDLRANHYLLPAFTTYNHSEIPFTYPPFGLYLAAVLQDLFQVPEMESLRWLPVLANVISIVAFYLLAGALLKDRVRGAMASSIYALAPGSYDWFIMGGGLTRSFGALFLLLSLYFLLRTFDGGGWKNIALTTLFCSLAVLSHPEYGLHTASACLLFWIFYGMSRQRTAHAAAIGFTTLALTSVWWIPLLAVHGVVPIISAFHTGMYERNSIVILIQSFISWNSYLPILLTFRILGMGWAVWKRYCILLAWLALPYFVEPRSAPAIAFYPIAMLTALGLMDALPWLLDRVKKKPVESVPLTETRWFNALTFLMLISLFIESASFSFRLINTTLKPPALEAFAWIKENTPVDAHFLILTGKVDAMVDPIQEWFPALAERRSQTTLQGLEWTLAKEFSVRLRELGELQSCTTVVCVEEISSGSGLDFKYLLIKTESASESFLVALPNDGYRLIHQNQDYSVYER